MTSVTTASASTTPSETTATQAAVTTGAKTVRTTAAPDPGTVKLRQQADAIRQTPQNTVYVAATTIDASRLQKRSVRLDVSFLPQNPELPTGCEITALTTALRYYGFSVSKTEMAERFLKKVPAPADFRKIFVGDPFSAYGFGCYAQPITDAANRFFATQKTDFKAVNRSGSAFESLLAEVEKGRPVIIWGTMSMLMPYRTVKWTVGGQTIQWIAPEHCLVLIGYDLDGNAAIMSDPQKGIVRYPLTTVKERYIALCSQCVVLEGTTVSIEEPQPTEAVDVSDPEESSGGERPPEEDSTTEEETDSGGQSDVTPMEDEPEEGSPPDTQTEAANE